jgi:hypothetical protein
MSLHAISPPNFLLPKLFTTRRTRESLPRLTMPTRMMMTLRWLAPQRGLCHRETATQKKIWRRNEGVYWRKPEK